MELAAFEKANGPLSIHLDEVLKKMNVERQAYHGKSFIGNNVHTCCEVTQILPLNKELMLSQKIVLYCCVPFFPCRMTTSVNYAVLW